MEEDLLSKPKTLSSLIVCSFHLIKRKSKRERKSRRMRWLGRMIKMRIPNPTKNCLNTCGTQQSYFLTQMPKFISLTSSTLILFGSGISYRKTAMCFLGITEPMVDLRVFPIPTILIMMPREYFNFWSKIWRSKVK